MVNNLKIKISVRNLNIYYGSFLALKDITLDIPEKSITAIIGPSWLWKIHIFKGTEQDE